MNDLKNSGHDLVAAIDYREQIQSRHQKEIILSKEILINSCEHIRAVFPGSFDVELLPLEILRDFFLERKIDHSLNIQEIEELIHQEFDDPNHPLIMLFDGKETKFDDFISMGATKDFVREIEESCKRLGFELRGGVTAGVTHQEIIQAEQQPVFLTETSVINITSNLYTLTHRVSKLLAKSMAFDEVIDDKYRLSNKLEDYKYHLLNNPELQRQWDFFFCDCAYNPNSPPLGEFVYLGDKHIQSCFGDMKEAMMLFVIGHEFGHHIANHSLAEEGTADKDEFKMEHEADLIGSQITMEIGRKNDDFNLFAFANVGAFCILKILEYVRDGHNILRDNNARSNAESKATHPPVEDRLGVMKAYIKNYEYDESSACLAISLIDLFSELIDFIWFHSSKHLYKLKESGVKPDKADEQQWLP